MNETIRIEKMTIDDIPAAYAINLEANKDDPWPMEWFKEDFNGVDPEEPTPYWFLAYYQDELAGFCGMYHNTSFAQHYCKIGTLAVSPAFQRKGIGKALMQKVLDTTKELGLDRAKLEVSTKNPAVKLYEALGFKIEEFHEKYYDKSGDDGYIMWWYDDK